MRGRLVHKIVKEHIRPRFEGWVLENTLLVSSPIDMVLYGFCFSGDSIIDNNCYLYEFGLPLYVQTEYRHMNFGDRVRGRDGTDGFDLTGPHAKKGIADAIDAISRRIRTCRMRYGSPERFVRFIKPRVEYSNDLPGDHPLDVEALFYSYVLLQQKKEAMVIFGHLEKLLKEEVREWGDEESVARLKRSRAVHSLAKKDMKAALKLLLKYRQHSIKALKLKSAS